MENPQILRKKLLAVLKAGIFGAVLFDAMIVAVNLEDAMWHRGYVAKPVNSFFDGFAYLLVLPSALITPEGGKPVNPYVVNGLLGAFLFVLISSFLAIRCERRSSKVNAHASSTGRPDYRRHQFLPTEPVSFLARIWPINNWLRAASIAMRKSS